MRYVFISIVVLFAIIAGIKPATAEYLTFSFSDPAGDSGGPIDLTGMNFSFDDTTGNYTVRLTSTQNNPFVGDFRASVNLFNPDLGTRNRNPSLFQDVLRDFNLSSPQTSLTYSGTNPVLESWHAGQRVAVSSGPFGSPDGGGAFGSGVMTLPVSNTPPFGRDLIGTTSNNNGDGNSFATIASAASRVLAHSVSVTTSGPDIRASFTPQDGSSLGQAAQMLGVDHFNWLQHITGSPSNWTYLRFTSGNPLETGTVLSLPLLDPDPDYPHSGIVIKLSNVVPITTGIITLPVGMDNKPFYYNENSIMNINNVSAHTSQTVLTFFDSPREPHNLLDLFGSQVSFQTQLVGVKADGSYVTWAGLGTNFTWSSNSTYFGESTSESIIRICTRGRGSTNSHIGRCIRRPHRIRSGTLLVHCFPYRIPLLRVVREPKITIFELD